MLHIAQYMMHHMCDVVAESICKCEFCCNPEVLLPAHLDQHVW